MVSVMPVVVKSIRGLVIIVIIVLILVLVLGQSKVRARANGDWGLEFTTCPGM